MIATFAALLFAHVLADFVLQTGWMARHKRHPGALALHGLTVLATALAACGNASPWFLALTAVHMAIDLAKSLWPGRGLAPFLVDQGAHLLSLVALAVVAPDLMGQGPWPPIAAPLMALTAGLILATRAGGFAVGLLMAPWAAASPAGLPGGGRIIGLLERGLIFALILTDQAQGIGYLVAAKSVLRFGAVGEDRTLSEYVIIGTLASVSWAIVIAAGTSALLAHLPPLGIPDLTP